MFFNQSTQDEKSHQLFFLLNMCEVGDWCGQDHSAQASQCYEIYMVSMFKQCSKRQIPELGSAGIWAPAYHISWWISNIHSFLLWHLSSCSLKTNRRIHVVTRFLFVSGRKPHPLITPYHLVAPIITTTLKHFLFDTGFLIKNKQDHTPSDDILKTHVYYDNYPHGKYV